MATDKSIFDIDPLALDEEWLRQPKLYHEYALKLANAREAFERVKAQRDVVLAEVDLQIRQDPQSFGLNNVTEKAVEKRVTLDLSVRKAQENVLEAKHRVDVLTAFIEALDHRKKALENAVTLLSLDYWAAPKAKGSAAKEATETMAYRKAFGKGKKGVKS